jgi:transcriptional regulator of aromatic amino acid metabolism
MKSTTEPVFEREKLGLKAGQRFVKFGQFRCRAVNFQTGEFRNLESFLDDMPHTLEMYEQRVSIDIAFPAMRQIAVKTESVIEATRLATCLGDKALAQMLERLKFAFLNFEVRNNGAAFIFGCHKLFLDLGHHATI